MRINIFFTSLFSIILLPSAFQVYFETTSMAQGLVISLGLFFFFYFCKHKKISKLDRSILKILFVLIFLFLMSSYSMILFDTFEIKRFVLSFFIILFLAIGAFYFVKWSLEIDNEKFHLFINIIFYILLLEGIIATIGKIIFFDKSQFIFFSEPSHFALIYLVFLSFQILALKNNIYIYTLILLSFIFALTLPNLTLLVGTFLVFSFYLTKKTFGLILIIFTILFFFTNFTNLEYFDYFLERLRLSNETKNISSLVFLSGWERAYLHLLQSNFFGIGFQQLGYIEINSYYQNKLAEQFLPEQNLYDGGSVASKLIAEFGIIGIIFLIMYIFLFIKFFFNIRIYKLSSNYLDKFYISVFLLSSVNLFLRGMGYFSPIMFLLLSSIIYFSYKKTSKFKKIKNLRNNLGIY